jgi:hypothetical protein
VLNGNWNDPAHIRSKITQDLVKAAGGLAPRIEYARLSVNGEYFGMYSIEESLTDHWANCFGRRIRQDLNHPGPHQFCLSCRLPVQLTGVVRVPR